MVAAKHFIQGQGCFSAVRALAFHGALSECARIPWSPRIPFRMLPTRLHGVC
jgi:hypothetical protein